MNVVRFHVVVNSPSVFITILYTLIQSHLVIKYLIIALPQLTESIISKTEYIVQAQRNYIKTAVSRLGFIMQFH